MEIGDIIEVLWSEDGNWYPAEVKSIEPRGLYCHFTTGMGQTRVGTFGDGEWRATRARQDRK